MNCLLCSVATAGGELWTVDRKTGFICDACLPRMAKKMAEEFTQRGNAIGIDKDLVALVTISVLTSQDYKRDRSAESFRQRMDSHRTIRSQAVLGNGNWLVRMILLHACEIKTVGRFETKEQADWFWAFWRSFVYTEVAVQGPDDRPIEELFLFPHRPRLLPRPFSPHPKII